MKYRKTKPIQGNDYHSHYILKSYADIIAEHTKLEQSEGTWTENETLSKVDRLKIYRGYGEQFLKSKAI